MEDIAFRSLAVKAGYKNILMSYFSFYPQNVIPDELEEDIKKFTIFLDSGGYTARVKGTNIDINSYVEFAEKYGDRFHCIANLDVLDFNASMINQKKLESTSYKHKVVPVYHYSEYADKNLRGRLEDFCKEYPYVALGGVAGTNTHQKYIKGYLDYCFKIGMKYKTKFHGFGMTSPFVLNRYPFYSVDSTSWMVGAKYGRVVDFKNGKMDFKTKSKGQLHPLHFADYKAKNLDSIKKFVKIEQHYTDLWKLRGIEWNN